VRSIAHFSLIQTWFLIAKTEAISYNFCGTGEGSGKRPNHAQKQGLAGCL